MNKYQNLVTYYKINPRLILSDYGIEGIKQPHFPVLKF
jgi:hypothetical protein